MLRDLRAVIHEDAGVIQWSKQFKADGAWVLRSIPRKASGGYDWTALPNGRYFIEWYEAGKRRRKPPNYNGVYVMNSNSNRWYDGLVVSVNHRYTSWFEGQANYT